MSGGFWNRCRNLYGPGDLLLVAPAPHEHSTPMRPIIGRLSTTNWVAHLALILAAAAAATVLASRAEGELFRKVTMGVLILLVLMLITQVPVEQRPPDGRVSYGYPYAICAAASILMLVGHSMNSEWLVVRVIEISALLFAVGLTVFAFQVRGLLRSA
jgi:hypothetical protein